LQLAHRTVGSAGVDGRYAHPASGGAQVFLVDDERRGSDAVGGEGRGGAGRRLGNDQGKVSAAALFETGLGGAEVKAFGEQELGCVCHGG
jgi:hypothetical protein